MNASSEKVDVHRRHVVGAAAVFAAAAQLGMLVLCSSIAPVRAHAPSQEEQKADIGFLEIGKDITLRRMVVHNPRRKGTVLFLTWFSRDPVRLEGHFPALADDFEVHAFDWPGYGLSSRPTVDRFSYAPKDYAHVLNEYIGKAGKSTHRSSRSTPPISEPCQRFSWPWKNRTLRGRSSSVTSPRSTGPVTCTRACKP